jgi:serine/threonine protein kinase
MEYCSNGTLGNMIEQQKISDIPIPEDRVWKIISQFFITLWVMNKENIAHFNLKDNNIFIDNEHNIKLGLYLFIQLLFIF